MTRKVAFLTIHGMGDTDEYYYKPLKKRLVKSLGDNWDKVSFQSIYYQPLVQDNQEAYFNRVCKKLDWLKMRKFVLYGFSDAGGLEYSRNIPGSVYTKVQETIFEALGKAYNDVGPDGEVVLIAQSLGCQVLSNYIWDAAKPESQNITHGVWGSDLWRELDQDELNFRRLKSLKVLITTGCNIPIFVAGLNRENITPIAAPNTQFIWENYYDDDDVLGWPLSELSEAYSDIVEDKEINAGGVFSRWTPFSHTKYWTDSDVIDPVSAHVKRLLA